MSKVVAEPVAAEENLCTFGAYRLMTAEIVFADALADRIMDAPGEAAVTAIRTGDAITWRDYDVTPGFPRLRAFIDRWRDDPELRISSVTVTEIAEAAMPAYRISPSTSAVH